MHATCLANIILLYYVTHKYLARGLNCGAAGHYDVSILVTFSSLGCPVLSHPPLCALRAQSVTVTVCRTKGVFLVGDIIVFVVERRSATLSEFWKLVTVEMVLCNDVCGAIRRKTNRLFVISESQQILLQTIVKLSWWYCDSLSSPLVSLFFIYHCVMEETVSVSFNK